MELYLTTKIIQNRGKGYKPSTEDEDQPKRDKLKKLREQIKIINMKKTKIVKNFLYDKENKKGDCCPECNATWDGGDIYERFLKAKFDSTDELHSSYKDKTLDEIKKAADDCGWSKETPTRFSKVIGMDLSMDPDAEGDDQYDGISYWKCPECDIAWHRFKGHRTDKFVPKSVDEYCEEKQIVYKYEAEGKLKIHV